MSFRIYRQGQGLVWVERLVVDSVDSTLIGLSCLLSIKTLSIMWHRHLSPLNIFKLQEALLGLSLSNTKLKCIASRTRKGDT